MLRREAAVLRSQSGLASDEVARRRLVSLEGFSFAFRAKNEEWRDLQLVSQTTFGLNWMAESIGSTPTKIIERVCISPASKEQICLLYTKVITNKDFKRKLTISSGQKKTKAWILNWSPERRYPVANVHFWQTFCAEITQTKTKP